MKLYWFLHSARRPCRLAPHSRFLLKLCAKVSTAWFTRKRVGLKYPPVALVSGCPACKSASWSKSQIADAVAEADIRLVAAH